MSFVKWKKLMNIFVNYVTTVNQSILIIVLSMWDFKSFNFDNSFDILHVWRIFLFYHCSLESLLLVYRDLTSLYTIHISNSTSTVAVNYDFSFFCECEHFTRYKIAMVYERVSTVLTSAIFCDQRSWLLFNERCVKGAKQLRSLEQFLPRAQEKHIERTYCSHFESYGTNFYDKQESTPYLVTVQTIFTPYIWIL